VVTPGYFKAYRTYQLPVLSAIVDELIIIPANSKETADYNEHSINCINSHSGHQDSSSTRGNSAVGDAQDCHKHNIKLLPHDILWDGDAAQALNKAAAVAAAAGGTWMFTVQASDQLQVQDPVLALQALSSSHNQSFLYCYTSNDTFSAKVNRHAGWPDPALTAQLTFVNLKPLEHVACQPLLPAPVALCLSHRR